MHVSGKWDVRVPPALVLMFPWRERRGYWYKVNRDTAREVVRHLAHAYGIEAPLVDERRPQHNGLYVLRTRTISIHARGHLKTVFHEFYHHLDNMTGGEFRSDDHHHLAWAFADKLWDALKAATPRTEDNHGD